MKCIPFRHGQTRWAKLIDFAPDTPDAMELWALGSHAILVKVISVCGLHDFLHQFVADIRERKSKNISKTVSASPLMLDLTVMSTSGVIPPFVIPPDPGIERPVMQAREFLTCRPLKSCESLPLFSLSASSPAPTLPRDSAKYLSSSFSLDRFQPLRGNTSPPTGEAMLPPPADDCMVSGLDDPYGVCFFRGQNPLVLCLDVRQSGLYCRPDPLDCCCILFRPWSSQDVWSRSGSSFGVPFIYKL